MEGGIFGRNILKCENQYNPNWDFLIEYLIEKILRKREFRETEIHPDPQVLHSDHCWIAFLFLPVLFRHNIFLYSWNLRHFCFHKDFLRYNHN